MANKIQDNFTVLRGALTEKIRNNENLTEEQSDKLLEDAVLATLGVLEQFALDVHAIAESARDELDRRGWRGPS